MLIIFSFCLFSDSIVHHSLSDLVEVMSSDPRPPPFPLSPSERPLDLTVKRTEMETIEENSNFFPTTDYNHRSISSSYQTSTSDYNTQTGEQCRSYFDTHQSYPCDYSSDTSSTSPSSIFPQSSDPVTPPPTFYPSPPSQEYNLMSLDKDTTSSCVLPKKRKNLWRPYDSRAAGSNVRGELEKDGDSLSDSGSSSSEHEFKTPSTPMDPMKKRKRNMLRYAEELLDNSKENTRVEQSSSSSSHMNIVQPMAQVLNSTAVSSADDNMRTHVSTQGSCEETESRENMISDFKKRDVFGWSLKLQKSPEHPPRNVNVNTTSNNVCKDGDKTYIELQTVKKNSPEKSPDSKTFSASNATKNVASTSSQSKKNVRKSTSPISDTNKGKVNDNETNTSGGRVFIQRRDNVIESYDETQNVPKKEQTKQNICLIDLIEEIEADALKREALEEQEKKNNNVVKLLEQCNFVKLQALDYLMANVLIQDHGPSFKNKNETVQKMLKGDKIGCVNMLDVIELQVEMGLN
ncbi:hypothetical protein ACF0H5_016677 [Mactra antiquata]